MKRIGLIGFGRFGKLLYKHLGDKLAFQIYDSQDNENKSKSDYPLTNLREVCKNSIIILAVPVFRIEQICREISSLIQPGTLIIDVCAVKIYPCDIMRNHLPKNSEILGSHPLFGPDSAPETLKGHKVVTCPVRIKPERLDKIRQFLEDCQLQTVEMTPEEHDWLMASSLALTHFLGRGLSELNLPDHRITTMDYQNLLHLMKKVNRDTRELFEDMHRFNPYTGEIREQLIQALVNLDQELKQKP